MRKVFFLVLIALFVASYAPAQSNCSTLTFLTESLEDFHVGEPSHQQIEAIGGTPPYTFTVDTVSGGPFPANLNLHTNGKITGVPQFETDTTVFVLLTDANGCHLTQAFAVRVVP